MSELASKKIIDAREKKGLTQSEVAEKLGAALKQTYSLRQYSKLEAGQFPKFKSEVITALDKILGTSVYELIYEQKVPHTTHEVIQASKDAREDFVNKYLSVLEKQVELQNELMESKQRIAMLEAHIKELELINGRTQQSMTSSETPQSPGQSSQRKKDERIFVKRPFPGKSEVHDHPGVQDSKGLKGKGRKD